MEILVGRGGNQCMPIDDEGVSKIHCKIEILESGRIVVNNLSALGTKINGVPISKRTIVKPQDMIRLGTEFEVSISQLIEVEDYSKYYYWQAVSNKYPTIDALQVFLSTSLKSSTNIEPYVISMANATLAYYKMQSGNLRESQLELYEISDFLYSIQDGNYKLQIAYASIMELVARLYIAAEKFDVAKLALDGCIGVLNRLCSQHTDIPKDIVSNVYQLMADISDRLNNNNKRN